MTEQPIEPLDEHLQEDLEDYELPEDEYPEQPQTPEDLGHEGEAP